MRIILPFVGLCGMVSLIQWGKNRKLKKTMHQLSLLQSETEEHYNKLDGYHKTILSLKNDAANRTEEKGSVSGTVNYTGCGFLDYILEKQKQKSIESGIEYYVEAEQLPHFPCSEFDTVTIFDNLLENARESCVNCKKNKNKRTYISIFMEERSKEVYIRIINSKKADSNPVCNDFVTTKEDKAHHGVGISLIRKVIKNYQGKITFLNQNNLFVCEICFPIQQKQSRSKHDVE